MAELLPVAEPLLTPKEVQAILKTSLSLIYKLKDQGRLPYVEIECPGEGERTKTLVRFKRDDVFEFINARYKERHEDA